MRIERNLDGMWCATLRGVLRPAVAEGETIRQALIRCWYLLKEQEDELQKMRTTLATHAIVAAGSNYQQCRDYGYCRGLRDLDKGIYHNKFPIGSPEHDGYREAMKEAARR